MTNNNIALKSDHVIYYCLKHNSNIYSNIYTENGKKGGKPIYNARILYDENKAFK